MGIDPARLDVEAVGINHFLFITKWYCDGRDAYADLLRWNENEFPAVWETAEWQTGTDMPGPVSRDLCARFSAFPCNGDEHMSDYFSWYTNTAEARVRYRAKIDYLDRHIARGNERWNRWSRLVDGSDEELLQAFAGPSGEAAASVVQALWVPGRSYATQVILPNHGAVAGLPFESALEMAAVVTTDDIRPIGDQQLATTTAPHIARRLAEEELQMQASLEQSRELVYRAMELDPYSQSLDQITDYVAGLAEINRDYLAWLK
jgi:alpha-galactosidase/6-phospho-beta-glucosidase family protein